MLSASDCVSIFLLRVKFQFKTFFFFFSENVDKKLLTSPKSWCIDKGQMQQSATETALANESRFLKHET